MADGSKIEWTDATWNPTTGCTRVSAGCDHCYIPRTAAFRIQHRSFDKAGAGSTTGVKLHSDRLGLPMRWRKPRRVFVNSLSDLFHEDIPDRFIADVFAVMSLAKQHTFQILTKRHARMRSLLNSGNFWIAVNAARMARFVSVLPGSGPVCLPNVWIGVSVENQHWADIRIPALLETPAAVRWLSCEPLLGPVNLERWLPRQFEREQGGYWLYGPECDVYGNGKRWMPGLSLGWVVGGGESGPGARPMHPDWARSLRDQCVSAGVPFFFKQWGEWCHSDQMPEDTWSWLDSAINLGGQPHPEPHRVGKKRAGRLLDGRTWDAYPQPRAEAVTV